jgi:hypothetical protein
MSTLRKRLADIEEQEAFRDWQKGQRQFDGSRGGRIAIFRAARVLAGERQ